MDSATHQAAMDRAHDESAFATGRQRVTEKPATPRREIIVGSGPHLTTEIQSLLRLRLRAAAVVLLIGFAAFLVRHVVGVLTTEPLDPLLLGAHVLVVLVLASCSVALHRRLSAPLPKLRIAELL